MKVLTSTLSDRLAEVYDDFADEFGFGPCGAYAALKREQGWGDIAVCLADSGDGYEFPHYIIVDGDDHIVDLANPFDESLCYNELELLNADEMPELCDDGEAMAWLRIRNI